jgi:hypothetical protein
MRSLWILPDRDQSGELMVNEDGGLKKLTDAINITSLPAALTLGIPEEILRCDHGEDVVYAQYARLSGQALFCVSMRCGNDRAQRTVTLTNIQVLASDEAPSLPPPSFSSQDSVVAEKLAKMQRHFADRDDSVAKKVNSMLIAASKLPTFKTFASEPLVTTTNKPDWMPPKRNVKNGSFLSIIAMVIVTVALLLWR